MNRIRDIGGGRFGMLVAVRYVGSVTTGKNTAAAWEFLCDCGNSIVRVGHQVSGGRVSSCGCSHYRFISEARTIHGHAKNKVLSSEYKSWSAMKARCSRPSCNGYENYGGRGIRVCDRWATFTNFIDDMGPKPTVHHQLDRVDNDGWYGPDNCRWSTRFEQGNNKRKNIMLTHNGETMCLARWSRKTGIHYYTLWGRLKGGWSVADSLTTKAGEKKR